MMSTSVGRSIASAIAWRTRTSLKGFWSCRITTLTKRPEGVRTPTLPGAVRDALVVRLLDLEHRIDGAGEVVLRLGGEVGEIIHLNALDTRAFGTGPFKQEVFDSAAC